jgi:type IV secretory pathway VirB2 component (pilin)
MKRKIFNFFIIISIILILTPISVILAQEFGDDTPATGFRSILSTDGEQGRSLRVCLDSGNCNFCDAFTVASNIFKFLRNSIAFPIAVLMIIYGGVMMIFSGGSTKRVANGKKAMSSALVGFAIVWGGSLILNSALVIIAGAPASYKGFINGDLSSIDWDCEKDYSNAPFPTNSPYPIPPGVTFAPGVKTDNVHKCIIDAIADLGQKYQIKVTSLNDGSHTTGSYHYKGLAADIQVNGRRDASGKIWDEVVSYLRSNGYHAFCDDAGKLVSCSQATHIHFDTKGMPGDSCP